MLEIEAPDPFVEPGIVMCHFNFKVKEAKNKLLGQPALILFKIVAAHIVDRLQKSLHHWRGIVFRERRDGTQQREY